MFNKPTVFIIGAGASAECGLPTGAGLTEQIHLGLGFRYEGGKLTAGDLNLSNILKRRFAGSGALVPSARELSAIVPTFLSIDEALHWLRSKPEAVEIGKLAISHYILAAERQSRLAPKSGSVNVASADGTWLRTFMSIALSGFDRDNVEKAFEQVTIIRAPRTMFDFDA
jgi:hypothetical protein